MLYCIGGHPLPNNLQIWTSSEQPCDFSNHGDSLLDHRSDYSFDSQPGDSLSSDTVGTVDPVEETNRVS